MAKLSLNSFGSRVAVLMPTLMQEMWAYERNFFTRSNISFPQLWALTFLYQRESCTMQDLSRAMHTRESTTTGLVDRMTRTGLIRRQRDKTDRRVVRALITAKGRSAMQELQKQRRRAFAEIFKRLTASDRSRWLEIIEKLVHEMSPDKTKDSK
jgi:MarR family transcriptional regulator, organic hydroperoxide resistance regulator